MTGRSRAFLDVIEVDHGLLRHLLTWTDSELKPRRVNLRMRTARRDPRRAVVCVVGGQSESGVGR
jgi:hypothetical protein